MGKGGMSRGASGETKDGEEENMAAWLLGINTLKIQPFELPPLGTTFSAFLRPSSISLLMTLMLDSLSTGYFLGPHDVRVRMKAVGICGSDVHYLKVNPLQLFQSREQWREL